MNALTFQGRETIVHQQVADPSVIACDTTPNSPYFKQFQSVYNQEHILTQEQKEAAIWWSDDPD